MEIFRLMGSVFVDTDKANESLSKTDKKAEGLGKKFADGAKTVGKWGLALGGACAAGATALMGMATKSAEATDRIDKMSQKVGLSREAFQEFDFICSQSGMSVDQLQGGMKTLVSQMDKVAEGNKLATANFEKLGISVKDANGNLRGSEEVFNDVLYTLADMEDSTERTRLATELFGKSGTELLPMLNAGSDGIEAMRLQAHDLGLVMGDESIDAGVKFTDTMDQLKRSFGTIVAEVGVKVMPMIQQFAEWVIANMPQIQEIMEVVFGVISQVVGVASRVVGDLIGWFVKLAEESQTEGTRMNEAWQEVHDTFKPLIEAIQGLVSAFVDWCVEFWSKYGESITKVAQDMWEFIKEAFKIGVAILTEIINFFTALFEGDWEGMCEAIKNYASLLWESIKLVFTKGLDYLKSLGELLLQIGKDLFTFLWDGIKYVAKLIFDWLVDAAKKQIDFILGLKDKMLNAGKQIFESLWVGLKTVWTNISKWVSDKVAWIADKLAFWKKSEKEMDKDEVSSSKSDVDGSHANGLSYVPFDGYRAELHEGERVLTKEENKSYNAGGGITVNIINPSVRNDDDLKLFERMTYNAFDTTNRALGVV